MWTKMSWPPSDGLMKPWPLEREKHLHTPMNTGPSEARAVLQTHTNTHKHIQRAWREVRRGERGEGISDIGPSIPCKADMMNNKLSDAHVFIHSTHTKQHQTCLWLKDLISIYNINSSYLNNTLYTILVLNQSWCYCCNCLRTVDDRLSSFSTVGHTRECVWRLDFANSTTLFFPLWIYRSLFFPSRKQ